jgi:predicted dehydrogenase
VTRPLRVGLIGAGSSRSWAARAHMPALSAVPDMRIVAVATTRAESAAAAARLTGAEHAFTDGRALAAHPDVDVVAVVVKVPAHRELVGAALAAGKHVYCEWPLAANLADAVKLRYEAVRADVVHMIGLQGRQSPELNFVRNLVRDGFVGRVLSCNLRQSTGHRGGSHVSADAAWGLDRTQGRNLLTIQGGHSIDALCYCLSAGFNGLSALVATRTPEATVIETGETVPVDTPDQVMVAGELHGGISASVHLQGGAPAMAGFRMDIHGDRGALSLSGAGAHNSDLVLTSMIGGSPAEEIMVPDRYLSAAPGLPSNPAGNVARQYLSLAAQIRDRRVSGPSFDDAVAVHQLLHSIQESSDTGCRRTNPTTEAWT